MPWVHRMMRVLGGGRHDNLGEGTGSWFREPLSGAKYGGILKVRNRYTGQGYHRWQLGILPMRLEFCPCSPINSHPKGVFSCWLQCSVGIHRGSILLAESTLALPSLSPRWVLGGWLRCSSTLTLLTFAQWDLSSSGCLENHIAYFGSHYSLPVLGLFDCPSWGLAIKTLPNLICLLVELRRG